ncbi:MAG: BolA/IbaG family iron-sulfur metabolism protein [Gammaproteobacteria bacterium]|nr:BolA/IbaG family iron-sulfur metabolism protein [Gammaproteobacteria bacterium]MDH5651050.1 BolA/IbaG family iron-sulfur metabolism protein [Gammaproteobacteria bacterium]
MSIQSDIEQKLATGVNALHLEVVNESNNHNVPPGSESHFKVTLVSDDFEGKTLINRHRMINTLLAEEVSGKIHALALHTYTSQEWAKNTNGAPLSPPCLGGGKG